LLIALLPPPVQRRPSRRPRFVVKRLMGDATPKYVALHNKPCYISPRNRNGATNGPTDASRRSDMATKKTTTSAEMFEFPTFDVSKMTDSYREMADKSVNQTKEAYAKAKTVAEDTTKAIEATLETAQAGTVELSLKAIDAVRTSTEQSLSHMEALLGIK